MKKIISAESVAIGHPDKVADQISDAILDAYLVVDPKARVACETLIVPHCVVLAGEITSQARCDFPEVVHKVLKKVGYHDEYRIENYIQEQSTDIAQAVNKGGAGDQGIMIGYATDETENFMPLPIALAHKLMNALKEARESGKMAFLGPDAKGLVEVSYDDFEPKAIESIILSTQHSDNISHEELVSAMTELIHTTLPGTNETRLLINPGGRFVIGGPNADAGMTGRKQMVDSYGPIVRHGGGAFSGKDPTKVDRSGAYLARYIAKNIVAAKLARRAEVAITYAIGLSSPINLQVETFGTSTLSAEALKEIVYKHFPLDVTNLIASLQLDRPIYQKTAHGGHFGRCDPDFTWESINCL